VRKLDAGPVIASKRFQVDDLIKAPELLSFLFSEGDIVILVLMIFDRTFKHNWVL
jgi:methionyl-tRNA formyltransferase